MRRAEEPTKNDSGQVRALVNRQVQAWEKRDFAIAADDWLPNGELFSPGGHVVKKDMQSAILDYPITLVAPVPSIHDQNLVQVEDVLLSIVPAHCFNNSGVRSDCF